MLERFRRHLEDSGLIPPGTRVLVGYSGGADSTCLLHLLHLTGVDVVAAHLQHGQRPEAQKESDLCAAFCEELGVPFVGGRADVPRMARELGIGLEEAGREARYGFFTQAARSVDALLIATAHTRTDHVETVLLNLARGCGLAGLSGIPERRGNLVRPLLPFDREETRAYTEGLGLWTHDDPSNVDVAFSRARVRLRILPELRLLNPAADAAIARLAEIADEEDRFLSGMAAAALEQSEVPLNGELRFLTLDVEAAFDRAMLTHLPPALFKRAARLAVGALGATLDHDQTLAIAAGVAGTERGAVTADGGEVVIEWDVQNVTVRSLRPSVPYRYNLTLPGETESEEFGWRFTAFESDPPAEMPRRASLEAQIDARKIRGHLHFRTPKPGDEMQPLGFNGHRKLSDLLSEAKLTAAARARLPLVCDLTGPVWAPGVCLDARVARDVETDRTIIVRFGPLRDDGARH